MGIISMNNVNSTNGESINSFNEMLDSFIKDFSNSYKDSEQVKMEEINVSQEKTVDPYSNTNQSTYSNIFINQFASNITNSLRHEFGDDTDAYNVYLKYLEGLRLRDLYDEDGHFNLIDTDEELARLKETLKELGLKCSDEDVAKYAKRMNEALDSEGIVFTGAISETGLDDEVLNSRIVEVVNDPSGYDALVVENDKDIWIVNSCTDENSSEDLTVIMYTILRQLAGSDDLYNYLAQLIGDSDLLEGDYADYVKDIERAKELFNAQIEANKKLIDKYVNSDKNLRLAGYSLGGGMMLDSYAQLVASDPDKYDDITVTVYNPFISYCVEDDDNKYGALVKALKNAKGKVVIYSNEGDVVTQFCGILDVFKDQIVYIPAKNENPYDMKDITDILNLIVNPNSRHSFLSVDEEAFDDDGVLQVEGNQITVTEIVGGDKKTNSYSEIIKSLINEHLDYDSIIENIESDPNNAWMADPLKQILDGFVDYVIDNAGDYGSTYDEFIEAIGPGVCALAEAGAVNQYGPLGLFANFFNDEEEFVLVMKEYFNTDEGKTKLIELINVAQNSKLKEDAKASIMMEIATSMITDIYLQSIGL